MSSSSKSSKKPFVLLLLLAAAGAGGWLWLTKIALAPPANSDEKSYIRIEKNQPLQKTLRTLEAKHYVSSARLANLYARIKRENPVVREGTYELRRGMNVDQVFRALRHSIHQAVRLKEYYWIARNAEILEQAGVCSAKDYIALAAQPKLFATTVDFPLPEKSLEGYLYPDTYELPPLLGAKGVIERQLKTFQKKVWEANDKPEGLARAVVVGSMVQLEVAQNDERAKVAGVIENRLKINMPLQIDATINYGLQKWRPLTYDDYKNVDSPYNTYRAYGLPPGPICSPSASSIEAALHPQKHPYLYYVAMPDRYHLFSATYAEHLANVRKRRAAVGKQNS